MEKDLLKFYKQVKRERDGVIAYGDDKGNYFVVALAPKYQHIAQLLVNCEYIEADAVQLKTLLYNGDIDKNMVFKKEVVTRPISKYEITKKERDKAVIVDHEVEVSKIWVVKNGFKLTKSFDNKEEALALVNELNNKLFEEVA